MSSSNTLSTRAVIALFKTGAWRAVKTHASESQQENARHGLTDEAKVQVRICSHPALAEITKLHAEARAAHYRLTLPATDDGLRLLAGKRQLEHSQVMAGFASRHLALVADFVAAYEAERASAPMRLNGLYIAAQWPSASDVAARFGFKSNYLEVPVLAQWEEWLSESAEKAEAELKDRLADAVLKLAHKLADPKAIFRDSLLGNLADICALAGDLNLRDDPTIAALATQAASLCAVPAEQLRESATLRASTASRASAICSMFKL
jgi:hypothetical protein